jgi:hypothetical protein
MHNLIHIVNISSFEVSEGHGKLLELVNNFVILLVQAKPV